MIAFACFCFVLAASATPGISSAGPSPIQSDLQTLNNDYKNLSTAIQSYQNPNQGFVSIFNAFNAIDRDTNRTTNDTQFEPTFTPAFTQSITNYLRTTLEPSIKTATQAYTSKKAQFASDGLVAFFNNRFKQVRSDTSTLGTALVAKSPSATQANLRQIFQTIDADFAAALSSTASSSSRHSSSTTTNSLDDDLLLPLLPLLPLLIHPRSYPQTSSDLKECNSDCQLVINDINSYNGIPNIQTLQQAWDKLTKCLETLLADLNSSGQLTAAQVTDLLDYFQNVLGSCIKQVVTALINKKAKFAADGLRGRVCEFLKTLKGDEKNAWSVLAAKAPENQKAAARTAQTKLEADLQRGLDAFC